MNQQIYIFHTLLQQVTQLTQLFQMHPFCNVFMVFWCFQGVEEACIGNEWVKSSNSCNYSFSFINSFTCPCNNSIFSFLLQISSLIWLLDVSLKYSKYFFIFLYILFLRKVTYVEVHFQSSRLWFLSRFLLLYSFSQHLLLLIFKFFLSNFSFSLAVDFVFTLSLDAE